MSSTPTVLFLGATGMIGYPALKAFVDAKLEIKITALVRSLERAADVKALGVELIQGDATDLATLETLSSQFDIVFDCVDSGIPEITATVVKGLKKRDGKGILYHISGAGNFWTPSNGAYDASAKVWDDANHDDIAAIHNSMKNGAGDRIALDADLEGDVTTYIVCPSGVYGPSARSGFGVQMNVYIDAATTTGIIPYVGEGSAVFNMIHVDDVTSIILLVMKEILSGPPKGTVYDRYFIAGAETLTWKTIADTVARVFYDKKVVDSPQGKKVTEAEAGPFGFALSTNMFIKCSNSTKLGWIPKAPKFGESVVQDLASWNP